MIVGAQKSGTTALAQFLGSHPEIAMSSPKETHLFDSPDYCPAWTPQEIDERYRPHFQAEDFGGASGKLLGEATPIYLFLPDVGRELKRYNPNLRLIVLLREPAQRAVSHYAMERERNAERLPLWLALLAEPFRQRVCRRPLTQDSAVRISSYRRRGLYSRQLANLYRWFGPGQVCVLRSEHLLHEHDAALRRVFAFLGVSTDVRVAPERVFVGAGRQRRHVIAAALLRLSYIAERRRLRKLLPELDG